MNKISLIIAREYMTRVTKKSFIVMSILGPLLFAALMVVPAWMATRQDKDVKTIAVIDSSMVFHNQIPESEYIKFQYIPGKLFPIIKDNFDSLNYYALLYIPHTVHYSPESVILYSTKETNFAVQSYISGKLEKIIENQKLEAAGIDKDILYATKTRVNLRTIKWSRNGEDQETNMVIKSGVGYAAGFLIYFFIFMFGAQVMRGVIEEKSGRIIEVIVASVKPIQLMMGKIVGIALVGLTQFALWILLTLILVSTASATLMPKPQLNYNKVETVQDIMSSAQVNDQPIEEKAPVVNAPDEVTSLLTSLKTINYGLVISVFLFYFLGGYLLYGSLFAAIGSAVGAETDTQQFMLPITIPLVLGVFIMINTIQDPETSLSFWFSMIPFTSPIVMMARIPFGVPTWELVTSMLILIVTFLGSTWLAAKIYRTGILMYGKKINYKELWKWLRYKN